MHVLYLLYILFILVCGRFVYGMIIYFNDKGDVITPSSIPAFTFDFRNGTPRTTQ